MRKPADTASIGSAGAIGPATRWVLMLPLAVLCAGLAYGISGLALGAIGYALLGPGATEGTITVLSSVIASALMAFVFVWAAAIIAPAHRARVVQALIGIGTAIAAIVMVDASVATAPAGEQALHGSLASGAGFALGLLASGFHLRRLRD